jgi:hypothetical protein
VKPRTKKIITIAIIVFMGCCCFSPLPVACGAPGQSCRTAPDARGVSHISYELEPLGIVLIEAIFRFDLPIYFTAWDTSG